MFRIICLDLLGIQHLLTFDFSYAYVLAYFCCFSAAAAVSFCSSLGPLGSFVAFTFASAEWREYKLAWLLRIRNDARKRGLPASEASYQANVEVSTQAH